MVPHSGGECVNIPNKPDGKVADERHAFRTDLVNSVLYTVPKDVMGTKIEVNQVNAWDSGFLEWGMVVKDHPVVLNHSIRAPKFSGCAPHRSHKPFRRIGGEGDLKIFVADHIE